MAAITNATLQEIAAQVDRRNSILQKFINEFTPTTWLGVQADVRAGKAKQRYAIGDELIGTYTYNNMTYECPWVVLDNDRECEWADGTKHPGLWIGMKYCTPEDMQFDAPEQEDATEETAQEGLYYCGRNGNTFTMLNLETGAAIPYGSYEHVYHGIINNRNVFLNGYNRWSHSGQRQWLNSDNTGIGEWWAPQHIGDSAPSQLSMIKGFKAGLSTDFLQVITPVKIKTACNTITDGGVIDTTVDTFFLQSVEEVFGTPQLLDTEGPYFPYWKIVTGLDEPTNGSGSATNEARKIRRVNDPTGNVVYVALRSSYRMSADHRRVIFPRGYIDYHYAYHDYASLPACVIS